MSSWEHIRNQLLTLSKKRGFQSELARNIGVHVNLIQKYVKGETVPGFDQVDKIAEALGLQAWELIKPDGATPTPKEPGNAELLEAMSKLQARIKELEAKLPASPLIENKPVIIQGGDADVRNDLVNFILNEASVDEVELLGERVRALRQRKSRKDTKRSTSDAG